MLGILRLQARVATAYQNGTTNRVGTGSTNQAVRITNVQNGEVNRHLIAGNNHNNGSSNPVFRAGIGKNRRQALMHAHRRMQSRRNRLAWHASGFNVNVNGSQMRSVARRGQVM